ncbi:MAG: MFS transporter [Clostridium sp.]|uniref:MFS transporter n=1 Tax=Clostridium sp. TaxID=1506 RepID=UPI002FCC46F3
MESNKGSKLVLVMLVYLAGIFMGAIDTGILTPARVIIQSDLSVDAQTGIWMITIYTLAYAASIPIMGKLADTFGRKYIYIISISLFGLGSLLCGLSQSFESFPMLIISRVIQAIGGGGIVPIATAEFGTSFPEEKRGMALGLIGGVYGVANIFGASAGSLILDIFGSHNWQYIFYINIPITIFIIIAGFIVLDNKRDAVVAKVDILGILTLTIMILSLLYGLKNIDFFNFITSVKTNSVYPFLLIFIVLLPMFILVEKKAADPVMNLKYFTNKNILITLVVSFLSGVVLMGIIFVPQLCENLLKMTSGSGGYLVIILGTFAGISAPFSGKLVDKLGPKKVLYTGFLLSMCGALFLIFVTTNNPSPVTAFITLALIGSGIGFTMGPPLNYMMLENTKDSESASALATLSLVRSIGTALAPAIMVGFIAHAGANVQDNIMKILPSEVKVPPLAYSTEITNTINDLKKDPTLRDKLKDINLPDFKSLETIDISGSKDSDFKISPELITLMQDSDVTTVTENSKTLSKAMFDEMTPKLIQDIQSGIQKGIDGTTTALNEIKKAKKDMSSGENGIQSGIKGIESGIKGQEAALKNLRDLYPMLKPLETRPLPPNMSIADVIPPNIKPNIPPKSLEELSKIKSLNDYKNKIFSLEASIKKLKGEKSKLESQKLKLKNSIGEIKTTEGKLINLNTKMKALYNSIPESFNSAKESYLKSIDSVSSNLESTFQSTLNKGFINIYLTTLISSILGIAFLIFYNQNKTKKV